MTPAVEGYEVQMIDESTLEVSISKEQSINALFQILSANGIEVLSMRNKTNRLEEMFIRMVEQGAL